MTTNDKYKSITIPNNVEDEAIDQITEVTLDEALDDIEQDDGFEPIEVVQKEPPAKAAEPAKKQTSIEKEDDFGYQKKASRSQKRIKQLHSRAAELEAMLEQERKEKLVIMQKYSDGAKNTKSQQLEAMDKQAKLLLQQQIAAMKEGDDEKAASLQQELLEVSMAKNNIDMELRTWQEPPKEDLRPIKQNQVPEKAMEWIEDHPQFKTDELFYTAAIVINNQLVKAGLDPESDEFYEEVSKRLAPRFPEVFGTKGKTKENAIASKDTNSVEYSDEDDDGDHFDTNEEPQMPKKRQTASGSNRNAPNNEMRRGRTATTVELSAQDMKQAERWGLTPQQMARRILHSQKTKRPDGYVPIFINDSK